MASSVNSGIPSSSGPSEGSGSEEKNDSQAEGEKREESEELGVDPFLPEERPPQKNKRKCWICKCKLELAQSALGTCKCGKLSLIRVGYGQLSSAH